MPSDATPYLLVVAALVVASHYFYQQSQELNAKINSCEIEYRGFRQGVLYGK
jgi:CHASE3 domain sensor protein